MASKKKISEIESLKERVESLTKERDALTKESDDSASRIVELQEMLKQATSPSETCKKEREAGNGGCGACALCCKELKDQIEVRRAQYSIHLAACEGLVSQIKERLKLSKTLMEVRDEMDRQDLKWGIQNHPDGTCEGPNGAKIAKQHADAAKSICRHKSQSGSITWSHIFTEEWLEAYAETHPSKLRAELIQVAAVAVQWVDCIDRRARDGAAGE